MADNYLENKYEAYKARKDAEGKAKKLIWKKRLEQYRKKLLEEEVNKTT